MKLHIIFLAIAISVSISACGQSKSSEQHSTTKTTKTTNKMNTEKLTNATAKSAFEAWQNGDSKLFMSYFASDAKLFDDGSPRDLQKFVKDACGHERFTTINKVENDGKDIYGNFHTESWGDFRTYFKFHFNKDGKIERLDIGQTN